MWNSAVLTAFFCVSRETLQVLSRGRRRSGYFATNILFVAEVVAYYNCFTWNIRCFDDNRRTLAITAGSQRPLPRIFFLFACFFHFPPPFLPVLLFFAYLSTRHFPCFACYFVFSFILPQYMQSKCTLRRFRVVFHVKHCFFGCFRRKSNAHSVCISTLRGFWTLKWFIGSTQSNF